MIIKKDKKLGRKVKEQQQQLVSEAMIKSDDETIVRRLAQLIDISGSVETFMEAAERSLEQAKLEQAKLEQAKQDTCEEIVEEIDGPQTPRDCLSNDLQEHVQTSPPSMTPEIDDFGQLAGFSPEDDVSQCDNEFILAGRAAFKSVIKDRLTLKHASDQERNQLIVTWAKDFLRGYLQQGRQSETIIQELLKQVLVEVFHFHFEDSIDMMYIVSFPEKCCTAKIRFCFGGSDVSVKVYDGIVVQDIESENVKIVVPYVHSNYQWTMSSWDLMKFLSQDVAFIYSVAAFFQEEYVTFNL